MMRNEKTAWIVAAVCAAVAVGTTGSSLHYRARLAELEATPEASSALLPGPHPDATEKPSAVAPTDGDILRLRQQVRDLEAELVQAQQLISRYEAEQESAELAAAEKRTDERREERPPRRGGRDWLERLRESDPERYDEIMAAREEGMKRMREAFARKSSHFLDRDTEGMSEQELAEHTRMLELLETTWEAAEKLRNHEIPREERMAAMMELRKNVPELVPMLDAERDKELQRLATDVGYNEKEAEQFVNYVNEVIEITSMRSIFESMRPSGGRGRRSSSSSESSSPNR